MSDTNSTYRGLSDRVLDSTPRGLGFKPHRRHCVVSLSKNINPSVVLVQLRKTDLFITERLLMGRKGSNQTNKQIIQIMIEQICLDYWQKCLVLYKCDSVVKCLTRHRAVAGSSLTGGTALCP